MSYSYKELRQVSDEELIRQHDAAAQHTAVGTAYYQEELARRDAQRVNDSMLKCTKWITVMTAVMLLATIINVGIAFYDASEVAQIDNDVQSTWAAEDAKSVEVSVSRE